MSAVDVRLPSTLASLFPSLPRNLQVEAETVGEVLACLDDRYPGLRDRLCEPGPRLRPHINVYVDGRRADVATPVGAGARVHVIAAISGG
jgi:molybdopterin synthase sulfur carrier subunit